MKVFYIGVWRNSSKPALELCSKEDVTSLSRFSRSTFVDFMRFFCAQVAERAEIGYRYDVALQSANPDGNQEKEKENDKYRVRAYGRPEGVVGVIVSDREYPMTAAHALLSKVVDDFLAQYPGRPFADSSTREKSYPLSRLDRDIVKCQEPDEIDEYARIYKTLGETKEVLYKSIENLLERGEKIENLVQKSDSLNAQSKAFYTQAKKQNSCCTIM